MDDNNRDYFRRREAMERAAAKQAACPEARRVHQELAQAYSESLSGKEIKWSADDQAPRSKLTIVTKLR